MTKVVLFLLQRVIIPKERLVKFEFCWKCLKFGLNFQSDFVEKGLRTSGQNFKMLSPLSLTKFFHHKHTLTFFISLWRHLLATNFAPLQQDLRKMKKEPYFLSKNLVQCTRTHTIHFLFCRENLGIAESQCELFRIPFEINLFNSLTFYLPILFPNHPNYANSPALYLNEHLGNNHIWGSFK